MGRDGKLKLWRTWLCFWTDNHLTVTDGLAEIRDRWWYNICLELANGIISTRDKLESGGHQTQTVEPANYEEEGRAGSWKLEVLQVHELKGTPIIVLRQPPSSKASR